MGWLALWTASAMAGGWPELSAPPTVGGGADDVALVVAIDDYWAVPDVPGATANGEDWYRYLVDGRGTPAERVRLLRNEEATVESMADALDELAGLPRNGGTAWVVFVGHGALDPTGEDQLLLGADVQGTASSLTARSLRRSRVEALLPDAVMVLDSCFSGLSPGGEALVEGLQPLVPSWVLPETSSTVLAAGRGQQFAGPLPGAGRPAFSYLVLGALQGWGDADADGAVSASEAVGYAERALEATLTDRRQQPVLAGLDRELARVGSRPEPNLGELVVATPRITDREVRLQLPKAPTVADLGPGRSDDLELERLLAVATARQGDDSSAHAKAKAWREVAEHAEGQHPYAATALGAVDDWEALVVAERELSRAFEVEYDELERFLETDEVPKERRLEVVDDFLARWEPHRASSFYYQLVEHARDGLQSGRRTDLVPYGNYRYAKDPGGLGPFFWGWDKSLLRHGGVVPFRFGVPVLFGSDPALGFDGQLALGATAGLLDIGLAGTTLAARQSSINFYAGIQPFAVRRRSRGGYEDPGRIKGSFINPMVGLGARIGFDQREQYLDVYVADHVFLTNSFGFRFEGRFPVAALHSRTVVQEMSPMFVPSVVFSPAW